MSEGTSAPGDPERKPDLWAQIQDFVNNMDERAWRAVAVTLVLFVVVGIMLVVGRLFYAEEIEAFVNTWLRDAEREHWGLPAAIAVFTITAYVGAPQFVLIAACVIAFGPEVGFWYSWVATIVSGVVTYFTGALSRTATLKRFGGATGGRFTRFMGQNAFMASMIIRWVPTAPFIVVNMAFGAARVNFWAFLAGMIVGVLPKTAIVSFGFDVIIDALEGRYGSAVFGSLIGIALWFVGVVVVRAWLRNRDQDKDKDERDDDKDGQDGAP